MRVRISLSVAICCISALAPVRGGGPTSVPAYAWHTADRLLLTQGATVKVWPDASGNEHDLRALDETKSLLYFKDGPPTTSYVRFAENAYMGYTRPLVLGDYTVFFIKRKLGEGGPSGTAFASPSLLNFYSWPVAATGPHDVANAIRVDYTIPNWPFQVAYFGKFELAAFNVFASSRDSRSGRHRAWLNGVPIASRVCDSYPLSGEVPSICPTGAECCSSKGSTSWSFFRGPGNNNQEDVMEVIVYDRALSDAEHLAVTRYLQRKYGFAEVDQEERPQGSQGGGHRPREGAPSTRRAVAKVPKPR